MSSAAVQGMATRSVKQLKIESLSTCSSYPKRYFLFIITGELSPVWTFSLVYIYRVEPHEY